MGSSEMKDWCISYRVMFNAQCCDSGAPDTPTRLDLSTELSLLWWMSGLVPLLPSLIFLTGSGSDKKLKTK